MLVVREKAVIPSGTGGIWISAGAERQVSKPQDRVNIWLLRRMR